ncbi:MAG: hypothetical protein H6822_22535 [Planctomycetaceae bacterium]|nr:hypothetical protein [Planctomycetales bacterium]MCB9924973.1 hypothetical protein [Planctomycetaceae bacterium]
MNRLFILTATVGLLMSSISVQAQQRGNKGKDNQTESTQTDRGEKQRDGQGKEGGGSGLFQLLDVDGDGNLSEKEIHGAVAALMKLDVNKDGILDAQELVVRGRGGTGGQRGTGGQGGQGKSGKGKRSAETEK